MNNSLRNIHGNARAALVMQPIWSVVRNLFMPYMTLYMLAVGCSNQQVGLVNAIGMIIGSMVAIFSGWITDRLGRRLANALADLICWALACLIWGLSQNYIWFLFAAGAQSLMRLSGVAWNCILSEGTLPEHRVNIFWWFSIVQTLTIFATPLMNLLIRPFGLVSSMRWVLIGSSIILTAAVFLRYHMMKDLPVSVERKKTAKNESPLAALMAYRTMIQSIKANPPLLIYILLRTLFFVHISLKETFLPVTVVQGMGFKDEIIGTLNFVTGAIMLLMQILLMPRLQKLTDDSSLTFSLFIMLASMLILVFAPVNSMALLSISTILYAVGSVISTVLVDTSLANAIPDKERAQLLSFVTVVTVAVSAPAMWLGGVLSDLTIIGPRLPMALISILFMVCLILLWSAAKMKRKA